ncbi:MAG TPA: exonuclease sbcCD subunit D [Ruminococcaceae bacterium]|nr:exonuclease sbcCD subunit D [Oscillospiraceae bacterium]
MKFIHLADLHIGKRVNEFSMIEDQEYILLKILNIIDEQKPDAVLISGDVYDKPVPSAQAVELFDKFINSLASRHITAFIISGNHDSAQRMAFASKLIDTTGIHFSPAFDGDIKPFVMNDEYGRVNIYMLPFIKPIYVRVKYGIEENISYSDAVETAISHMNVNTHERNIILSHQFVTGADRCDSEDISVGGTDGVSAEVYNPFDYAALGHLHSPQSAGRDTVRYAGTPLKYSFSEINHNKSITVVEMRTKGDVDIKTVSLVPKRDMAEIKGSYDEIMQKSYYEKLNTDNYYHIILTDENDIPDALSKLRNVYKNIMKLDYDNTRTRSISSVNANDDVQKKNPVELAGELYLMQNSAELSSEQLQYLRKTAEKIWEGNE